MKAKTPKCQQKGGVGKSVLCILLHEAMRKPGQAPAIRDCARLTRQPECWATRCRLVVLNSARLPRRPFPDLQRHKSGMPSTRPCGPKGSGHVAQRPQSRWRRAILRAEAPAVK